MTHIEGKNDRLKDVLALNVYAVMDKDVGL